MPSYLPARPAWESQKPGPLEIWPGGKPDPSQRPITPDEMRQLGYTDEQIQTGARKMAPGMVKPGGVGPMSPEMGGAEWNSAKAMNDRAIAAAEAAVGTRGMGADMIHSALSRALGPSPMQFTGSHLISNQEFAPGTYGPNGMVSMTTTTPHDPTYLARMLAGGGRGLTPETRAAGMDAWVRSLQGLAANQQESRLGQQAPADTILKALAEGRLQAKDAMEFGPIARAAHEQKMAAALPPDSKHAERQAKAMSDYDAQRQKAPQFNSPLLSWLGTPSLGFIPGYAAR